MTLTPSPEAVRLGYFTEHRSDFDVVLLWPVNDTVSEWAQVTLGDLPREYGGYVIPACNFDSVVCQLEADCGHFAPCHAAETQ